MSVTTINLRQLATEEVARVEFECERDEQERQREEYEERREALTMLLHKRLGIEIKPHHDTITIDDITFTVQRGYDRTQRYQLQMFGKCPKCGDEALAEVYSLYDVGRLLVDFQPNVGHMYACEMGEQPAPPPRPDPAAELARALAELLRQHGYLGGES